jgi:FKBP-type peptidyl-prolyl cis-trans isomerase SlyD
MNISKDTAVTIRLKVSDQQGQTIENGKEPVAYLHGGYNNLLPKIEEALEGQAVGFKLSLDLSVADAFGERDESLVQTIAKTQFPPGVKVGGQLEGRDEAGKTHVFTVVKIKGPQVILDANHPLAGRALKVSVEVLGVRPATAEEIGHGHVHGEHGHQH